MPTRSLQRWTIAACAALAMSVAGAARAGPPFFTAGTHVQGDSSGVLAGTEVNYGAAPNLQLHIIAPLAYDDPRGGSTQVGVGDIELGAKYRFITPGEKDWFPQVGIFPLIEVPSGNADRGLGQGRTRVFLPVWLQKDFGDWTT